MKLTIVRSVPVDPADRGSDPYLQEFDTRYAPRVIGNLVNRNRFCTSCGPDCIACRDKFQWPVPAPGAGGGAADSDTVHVVDMPSVMPHVLENPRDLVPPGIGRNDILLLVNIHEQVLLEIVRECPGWGTRGVVVPIEAPDWVRGGTRTAAVETCRGLAVEISFPKPFCAFDPPPGGVLAEFRRRFRIGKPDVTLDLDGAVIRSARVNVSAACGATYYIARWLEGRSLEEDLELDVISRRFHSYPCTASMERDPELGDDTPLHVADEAHTQILSGLGRALSGRSHMVMSPLGVPVQRPEAFRDSIRNIEEARAWILALLSRRGAVSLAELKDSRANPAAVSSAVLLLKNEGLVLIADGVIRNRA